jgi:hypothetical protein
MVDLGGCGEGFRWGGLGGAASGAQMLFLIQFQAIFGSLVPHPSQAGLASQQY